MNLKYCILSNYNFLCFRTEIKILYSFYILKVCVPLNVILRMNTYRTLRIKKEEACIFLLYSLWKVFYKIGMIPISSLKLYQGTHFLVWKENQSFKLRDRKILLKKPNVMGPWSAEAFIGQRKEGSSRYFFPCLVLDIKADSQHGVGRTWTLVTSCCQLFWDFQAWEGNSELLSSSYSSAHVLETLLWFYTTKSGITELKQHPVSIWLRGPVEAWEKPS